MKNSSYTIQFIEMLVSLLGANITLRDAIGILSKSTVKTFVSNAAQEILQFMKKGSTFSYGISAVSSKPKGKIYFDRSYISLISAAETTGKIDTLLQDILSDLQRKKAARENIISVLIYPVFIIIIALAGTIVLIIKGLPLFIKAGFLSQQMIDTAFSGIVTAGIFLLSAGTILLLLCYYIFGKDNDEFRIFHLLSFLLRGKILVSAAIGQCIENMGETKAGKALVAVKREITSGVGISQAFSRSGFFSSYTMEWLSIAEENGNITEACRNIADYHRRKTEKLRDFVSHCTEPAMIIITGIYLLILIQSVILPVLTYAGRIS